MNQLQEELLGLFLTTKTNAKVLRRKKKEDGSYEFYEHYRDTSPIDFPVNDEEFAIKAHEKDPNAPLSPIYVNLRNLPAHLIDKIAQAMKELNLQANFVTGIPTTAISFAKSYSEKTSIPFVDIIEKSGTSINRKLVAKEGAPKGEGKSILIIDDVISQGNSKFEVLKVAEELGYKVAGFVVLIDRAQGGSHKLSEMGVKLHSVFTLPDIVEYYKEKGQISEDKYRTITAYFTQST
jgi:orotate phosphoribosyltransferase